MALNPRVLLVPHHPALLLDSRNGRENGMQEALRRQGAAYRDESVQVVVLLSSFWYEEGPFQVDSGARLMALQEFAGCDVDLRYTCAGWRDLAEALHENGLASGLPVETVHRGMDHAASVPLSYMFPEADRRLVLLSVSPRSQPDYDLWGAVVRETCKGAGAHCAIIVGGSLSWDHAAQASGTDVEGGEAADRMVLSRLEAGRWSAFGGEETSMLTRDSAYAGMLHMRFLGGVLGHNVKGEVLEYERRPGVGSALVEFTLPEASV